METFNYCIRPHFSVENEPAVSTVEFGDGYTQRQLKGVHFLLRTYPVSVKVKNKERLKIDAFFTRHKGITPFYFHDPYTGEKKKVVCPKWTAKMGQTYTEFTCEFKEQP